MDNSTASLQHADAHGSSETDLTPQPLRIFKPRHQRHLSTSSEHLSRANDKLGSSVSIRQPTMQKSRTHATYHTTKLLSLLTPLLKHLSMSESSAKVIPYMLVRVITVMLSGNCLVLPCPTHLHDRGLEGSMISLHLYEI